LCDASCCCWYCCCWCCCAEGVGWGRFRFNEGAGEHSIAGIYRTLSNVKMLKLGSPNWSKKYCCLLCTSITEPSFRLILITPVNIGVTPEAKRCKPRKRATFQRLPCIFLSATAVAVTTRAFKFMRLEASSEANTVVCGKGKSA